MTPECDVLKIHEISRGERYAEFVAPGNSIFRDASSSDASQALSLAGFRDCELDGLDIDEVGEYLHRATGSQVIRVNVEPDGQSRFARPWI